MRTWMFWVGAWVTGILLWLVGPARIEGLEHVPRSGAFLMVANHASNIDPPALGWGVGYKAGRVIHFMAKDEMRRWPIAGWLASQAGVFFVRRREADRAAQRTAIELLDAGRPVVVFPEGARSRDGNLTEPRLGAALLAMRSGAPVLPVAIAGSHRLLPRGSWRPRRSPMTITIGQPFELPRRPNGWFDREELRAESERLMRAIAALLPEEQRGRYGADAVTPERA